MRRTRPKRCVSFGLITVHLFAPKTYTGQVGPAGGNVRAELYVMFIVLAYAVWFVVFTTGTHAKLGY